VQSVKIDRSKL